jgi:transcriptional regulator with XRE-family HTH domain
MSENPHDKSGLERRITERLLELGLSPRAASVQAGGGPDLIRNIIRGRSQAPRAESLVRLASVLQVSLDYLKKSHETIYPQREPLIVGRVKKSILKM